ncbi:hypothetical protein BDV23DRAFT_164957 [Aspergillus alliaceus]|uniref:Cytochrome P450 n=1 Tax=Petromyces alliaceus TaxID=209559 RepID=A0A5N7BU78_PETAA|nr:hypothetical protein BDV23DRAFT_164957 [Aspergillus alliaceus]
MEFHADKEVDPEYSKFPFTRPNGDELPAEFHRLLRECPVSRAELWDGSHPWLVVKHKDVCDMLIYPRLSKFVSEKAFRRCLPVERPLRKTGQHSWIWIHQIICARGPRSFFTKEYVKSQLPFIQDTVQRYLDELIAAGNDQMEVDLVKHFALPTPSRIIYCILGIPHEDFEYLSSCDATRTNGSSTAAAAQAANK